MPAVPLPPPAVVRLMRTMVVRRVLRAAVFLGGFLVLGVVLGGGTAHAAEADPVPSASSVAGLLPGTEDPVPSAAQDVVDGERRNASLPHDGLMGRPQAVEDTVRDVVDPVAGTVGEATDPVGEVVGNLPGLPVVPVPPGDGPGVERPGPDPEDRASGTAAGSGGKTAALGADTGKRTKGGYGGTATHRRTVRGEPGFAGNSGEPAPAHLPQAPSGAVSHCSVTDGSGHRGGDVHAVSWPGGTEFVLAASGVTPASEPTLRERPSDVLELPG